MLFLSFLYIGVTFANFLSLWENSSSNRKVEKIGKGWIYYCLPPVTAKECLTRESDSCLEEGGSWEACFGPIR